MTLLRRRNRNVIRIEAPLLKASREDGYKGWIRISEQLRGGIKNESYIKVRGNDKELFCQVRGTPGEVEIITMNEHYRNRLGWDIPPSDKVSITIERANFWGKVTAISSHPDSIVRVGFGLGCIGVGLGFIGWLYAVLPSSVRLVLLNGSSNKSWGIVGIVTSVFFAVMAVLSMARGIRALIR